MIKSQMPIERAHMRIKVTASKDGRKLKEKLSKLCTSIETEEWEDSTLTLVSISNFLIANIRIVVVWKCVNLF